MALIIPIIERHLVFTEKLSESFKFYRWECFPKQGNVIYFELEGGDCVPMKSGPRKGRPNYKQANNVRTFVVTVADSERLVKEYEEETGNCRNCMGSKQTVGSVGRGGTTYRTCSLCGGNGKRIEAISDLGRVGGMLK